ncbi:hypothetical protein CIB48_g11404 [Xylaria polymorpha]|nr:hypothetical protein CIB48_g11404 [Xylaria polymorpha]
MSYRPFILETMRRGSITLVSATYGTEGHLHQNVISGPKITFPCLPEEGLYILCRNRGLQIASACDRRKCYITQVCRCAEQERPEHGHLTTLAMNARTEEQSAGYLTKRFVQDRALAWLNFYQAADEIRRLKLSSLAHPRTLSWENLFDNLAFHFDSELEEHYASTYSYRCAPRPVDKGAKECPRGLLSFIRTAWQEFVDRGDYDFRPATAFPEREDDEHSEDDEDPAYHGDGDDMSEWDDADAPIHIHIDSHGDTPSTVPPVNRKKRPRPEDDFDFIDDLIDEEFPRLKKTLPDPAQITKTPRGRPEKIHKANNTTKPDVTSDSAKTTNNNSSTTAVGIPRDELPLPVIIPPKNMLIGRGLLACSFGEQQGFGHHDTGYGRLRQPKRAVLQIASPC